jgi:hypothetical protein
MTARFFGFLQDGGKQTTKPRLLRPGNDTTLIITAQGAGPRLLQNFLPESWISLHRNPFLELPSTAQEDIARKQWQPQMIRISKGS